MDCAEPMDYLEIRLMARRVKCNLSGAAMRRKLVEDRAIWQCRNHRASACMAYSSVLLCEAGERTSV